jgi:predicted CXXCH cytochrome family protein
MRTRALLVAAGVALLAGGAARAADAPHDASTIANATGCDDCHKLHGSIGPALGKAPDNFTVCTNCHNNLAAAFTFGGKWYSSDQATPGAGGRSHRWAASTTNGPHGATPPANAELLKRTPNGFMQCSTCHDQHLAEAGRAPHHLHVSVATDTPLPQSGGPASGATMKVTVAGGAAAAARGYRIRIGPANDRFQVSHDARNGWGAAVWSATPYAIPGANVAIALSQPDDDPAVSVSFGAIPTAAGGYWDFYVSYPFLRMSIAEGELCLECHPTRNQAHADLETSATYGWASGKPFSHPVGEALNANGRGYDVATPLEVMGGPQGATPSSSHLRLSPTGKVTCLSCHAAHNADSNSQTVDAR